MTREKSKQDIVISIFLYALSAYVFSLTGNLGAMESKRFPYVILSLIVLLTTILFTRALKVFLAASEERREQKSPSGFDKVRWFPYFAFIGIVLYAVLFDFTNYFFASAALIMVFLLINKIRPIWLIGTVTGGYLFFAYILFVQLLKVKLI